MGSPLGGSILMQRAPMAMRRISAAGPGRLSAKLSTRTPRSGFRGLSETMAVLAAVMC